MAALNGSSFIFETLKPLEPYSELWQGYIKQAQSHVSSIPDLLRQGEFDLKSVVVLVGGLPVVLILLNVLSQVVCYFPLFPSLSRLSALEVPNVLG